MSTEPIARWTLAALDTTDPRALAAFYGAITGWPVDPEQDDDDWVQLGPPGGGPTIACQHAPDHVPPRWPDAGAPQQAHLDFDVDDLDAAGEEVVALGATFAGRQPGAQQGRRPFHVYLDPAGHPFCLVRTR